MLGENNVDTMLGRNGNDTIIARGGNDILRGEAGNDKLTGGLGADLYSGGAGKDTFFINSKAETGVAAAARDKIMDFVRGQDKIDLSKIDSNPGGSNDKFEFIGTKAFGQNAGDVRGQLRYEKSGSNVIVFGDIGHNGSTDLALQINGHIAAFGDFFVL